MVFALLIGGAIAAAFLRKSAPEAAQFVGSAQCAGCHEQAFADWQESHHHQAMLPATAQSVRGDFNNVRFDHFGTTSRFFTQDGSFFVETDNADGELETFKVAYTFGWYPLQQYLIEFPDGRMQALGISWDVRPASEGGQRWYHLYPDEPLTHDDPLHWTGAFQNWNSRCASCHSTGLVKGYQPQQDAYETRWQEINVGCEACHGPASRHMAWANGRRIGEDRGFAMNLAAVWEPAGIERPIPPRQPAMSAQLQVCSACHSRRTELAQPDANVAFFDQYTLSPLLEGMYHPDGQILDEVFETGSFLQSRMHQNHVSCTNCHQPHSARLRASGNALCLQCHEPARFQTRAHFFHEPDSSGAQCTACHMDTRTYMGVDIRHDHSFRVPDPVASQRFGVPNACTQCHKDRDDAWAAAFLTQRTGRTEPRYGHAALIAGARQGDPAVVPGLLEFAGQGGNSAMLRAIALQESARFPSQQQVDVVSQALVDADPLVRVGAASALGFLEARQRLAGLSALLSDPVKAVRMAAARQLVDLHVADAPPDQQARLQAAFDEYRAALLHNADMPESMNDLGVFLSAQGDSAGAEEAFAKSRRLSPRYLPALLNLSDAYRARGRDDLGEALLLEAREEYPESGDVYYMLGLLHVRTDRAADSVALFRRASELSPGNARYALVHAMALIETGQRQAGIRMLESAATRFPADAPLRQALESYRPGQPR